MIVSSLSYFSACLPNYSHKLSFVPELSSCIWLITISHTQSGIYEQDMKSIRSRMAKAMLAAVKDCISKTWNLNQLNKNGVSLVFIL